MAQPVANQARGVAAIETRLQEIQAEERRDRMHTLVAGYLLAGLGAGLIVSNEVIARPHDSRTIERGYLIAITGTVLALTLREQFSSSGTDKFIELWRRDPRHRPLDLTLAPLAGGGIVALSGSF